MLGLVPVCSNVSDSTRLVLTLYEVETVECRLDLVLRPSSLVMLAPVTQHNRSHGYFSVTFSSRLLPLHQQQSTTAFCILVNIGMGQGSGAGVSGGGQGGAGVSGQGVGGGVGSVVKS